MHLLAQNPLRRLFERKNFDYLYSSIYGEQGNGGGFCVS